MVVSVGIAVTRVFQHSPSLAKVPGKAIPREQMLLVVILHSECPSSIATVDNLLTLPGDVRSRLQIRLIFTGPNVRTAAVTERSAALRDADREYVAEQDVTSQYGATKSGQAYLYDRTGQLVFSGGLTSGLGCAGNSVGMMAIEDAVAGREATTTAPVYGCPLLRL